MDGMRRRASCGRWETGDWRLDGDAAEFGTEAAELGGAPAALLGRLAALTVATWERAVWTASFVGAGAADARAAVTEAEAAAAGGCEAS
jgi:hypothetical protein